MCNATAGNITVALPAASGISGREYDVIKADATGNTCTVDANGTEKIDGELTQVLSSQYVSLPVVCDGTQWWIY